MRVLFVHDVIGDLGGAEANVRLAASGLLARGNAIAFLHGAGTGAQEERFTNLFTQRFSWCGQEASAVSAALAWKPDVVYVHKLANQRILAGLVAAGRPLVRMVHDHDMYCQRSYRYFPWNRRICTRKAGYACALTCGVVRNHGPGLPLRLAWPGRKLAELQLCRQFDRHIVVTQFMRDELILHDFPADRIVIMPPVPKPAQPAYTPVYRLPRLVFVGQIQRGKGLDVLIQALPLLKTPHWELVVIGDGAHRRPCEALVAELGLAGKVTFTGWVPQEHLMSYYTDARCGVVPSVWPEPIATIGLEFMHHALPVVGFDAGGIKDWLRDGENGFLCPLWNTASLAAGIDRCLASAEVARQLGSNGLARAQRDYVYEKYLDALHELMHTTAQASA